LSGGGLHTLALDSLTWRRRVARGCLQAAKIFKDGGRGFWRVFSLANSFGGFFNAKEFPAFFLILYLEKALKLNDEMLLKETD
jgi:hypothetical protein